MKVTPAVAHADLRNGVKKLFSPTKGAGGFGAVAMVTTEKDLALAVTAVVAADEKRKGKASA